MEAPPGLRDMFRGSGGVQGLGNSGASSAHLFTVMKLPVAARIGPLFAQRVRTAQLRPQNRPSPRARSLARVSKGWPHRSQVAVTYSPQRSQCRCGPMVFV